MFKLICKNHRQQHISICACHLVTHDLAWFIEGEAYLAHYWRTHNLADLFDSYQEFLEETGYAVNEILLSEKPLPPLRLVVNNAKR